MTSVLSRLTELFASGSKYQHPSALLIVCNSNMAHMLHIVPETGLAERLSYTTPSGATTFHRNGATECSREQIGDVTLHIGDGETVSTFLEDVSARATELWSKRAVKGSGDGTSVKTETETGLDVAEAVLHPAAADALREREGRPRSMNATQAYPVFLVRVDRSSPGKIVTDDELTSLPH